MHRRTGAGGHQAWIISTSGGLLPIRRRAQDPRMIHSIGRRLRLPFGATALPAVPATPGPPAAAAIPVVEFVAYGEDCLLSGHIRLAAERLTDMLNEHDEYELIDVLVERLDGTQAAEVRHVVIPRDELLLVHAAGPRGSQARRQRMRLHPLAIQLGPYHVRGYLHALPGTDPLLAIRRRKVMVPLTDATVERTVAGAPQRRAVGTLVVNREQIDWVSHADDADLELPELPDLPMPDVKGPLVKDFTGAILTAEGEPSGS